MTIHIVTVYNSMNYGSFFQAKALMEELQKFGTVDFVDVHHQNTLQQMIIRLVKEGVRFRLRSALLEFVKYREFNKAQVIFPLVRKNSIHENDVVILGSDEIWNISRKKIRRTKEFWGIGIESDNIIAVAPSINDTKYEELTLEPYISVALSNIKEISVRDEHTKECIDKLIGINSTLVSDPTMMFPASYYISEKENGIKQDYIVLYTYGAMVNDETILEIRRYADLMKYKIISIGKWYKFCDACVAPSPEQFLAYIQGARLVLTDTFHGTVFSILFQKNFVSYGTNNKKVTELLERFGLLDRLNYTYNLYDIAARNIDYNEIIPKVREIGNTTRRFIRESLTGVCI